ncbi:hypothetical protein Tco_1279120 [Tanacetum coccineum]
MKLSPPKSTPLLGSTLFELVSWLRLVFLFLWISSTSTSHVGLCSSSSTSGSDSACLQFCRLNGRIVGRIVVGKRWLGLVVVVVVEEIG